MLREVENNPYLNITPILLNYYSAEKIWDRMVHMRLKDANFATWNEK